MEDLIRPIYQQWASRRNTLGILLIEKKANKSAVTDTFHFVLLVVVADMNPPIFMKHYASGKEKAALYVVDETKLNEWLLLGNHRKAIDWIFNGKILFDRNEYIHQLRNRMTEFPKEIRQLKMGLEFVKLVRRYMDGKAFFEANQLLDAYHHVIHALHHLARLAVMEQGFYPEVTVWNQVKQIDVQIYKLYEELVSSEEPLPKRLELLFLASEFLIHSRISSGTAHLCNVLREKEGAWSIAEMVQHPKLASYSVDLIIMLEYLVERKILYVKEAPTKSPHIYHRYYSLKNEKEQ